jgi:oxalate decarboxylase
LINSRKKQLYISPGQVPQPGEELRKSSFRTGLVQIPAGSRARRRFLGRNGAHFTAKQLPPVQTTLTAVRMDLQPGALREMHLPHADEWQCHVKGRARMPILGSHGRIRTEEFGPAHVGFIPQQGYGHYVEQLGDEPTEILILFNSPEYQEISLSNWLGANPVSILETNFGISRHQIEKMPK